MSSNDDQIVIQISQRNASGLSRINASEPKTFAEKPKIVFRNISYQETVKRGFLLHRKTVEKEMLSNINGIMEPGLNAIMGPPDGGRSLLLDILALRKDPSGLSGDVLINGAPPPANFNSISCYVVQDDAVMHTLTVRENLQFSAALRLPTTMTNLERYERVNRVIEELQLEDLAESKVTAAGETKRTRIAMELITDPSILFLKEPTTGLDSSTVHTIFLQLKWISEKNRTIIFSIHQPPYSIFKWFTSLTLLASGKLMFHGPAKDAEGYFKSAGYHCEDHHNPADFFLDVINGDISAETLIRENEDHEANGHEEFFMRNKQVTETLAELYTKSSFFRVTKDELDQLPREQKVKRSSAFKRTLCATSFWHQLRWIAWRAFKNLLGYPRITITQVITLFIVGLLAGAIFLGLKNDCTEVHNRASILLVLTVYQCFGSVSAGELFVLEKNLFIHEYVSGYYGVTSYFFGKLLADLLPRRFLPSVVFTCTLYFMLGLKPGLEAFLIVFFTIMMVTYTASSMALAIAISQRLDYMTHFLMNIYIAFMVIFLATAFYFETTAPRLSWLQYFSIPHYGFMALQYNEFLGQNYCPGFNTKESSVCPNYVMCTGDEFLALQGIDASPWNLWKNHVGLAVLMSIFLVITYLKLFFLKKYS
ncbi:ATP-binding cassette sub-family G member 2 [Nannospalax galili]|uniref:ATP-binding cassette sub-family G member 2 n=1 Tax=Nannospalax galili TaxID=1026970 RepID=UPI0004ED3CAB|nr:ATP-binding cassette sub-family G member 2 [Nannospalax galili]XP_017652814.1 ATP-binding cassette sub-family G member 2 [Nannospalax galili]